MRSRSNYDRYFSLGGMGGWGGCRNITNIFSSFIWRDGAEKEITVEQKRQGT